VIVVTCDWDCNKGINNPNGVFSGETLYNWGPELVKYPDIVQYLSTSPKSVSIHNINCLHVQVQSIYRHANMLVSNVTALHESKIMDESEDK
jgi:hypothetical protein